MQERKLGCSQCYDVVDDLMQIPLTSFVGTKFLAFFCQPCYTKYKERMDEASAVEKANTEAELIHRITAQ